MIDIAIQWDGKAFWPFSAEDYDKCSEYKVNQVCRGKISGVKKPRSVAQLNLLMACCALAGDNLEHQNFNSKEKMKFACKVHTHFVVPGLAIVRPDGTVQFQYRSFSFKNLYHMEACNLFDRCFDYIASLMGITVDKLIQNAKDKMLRKRNASNTKKQTKP